jgi:hypothetical protein
MYFELNGGGGGGEDDYEAEPIYSKPQKKKSQQQQPPSRYQQQEEDDEEEEDNYYQRKPVTKQKKKARFQEPEDEDEDAEPYYAAPKTKRKKKQGRAEIDLDEELPERDEVLERNGLELSGAARYTNVKQRKVSAELKRGVRMCLTEVENGNFTGFKSETIADLQMVEDRPDDTTDFDPVVFVSVVVNVVWDQKRKRNAMFRCEEVKLSTILLARALNRSFVVHVAPKISQTTSYDAQDIRIQSLLDVPNSSSLCDRCQPLGSEDDVARALDEMDRDERNRIMLNLHGYHRTRGVVTDEMINDLEFLVS